MYTDYQRVTSQRIVGHLLAVPDRLYAAAVDCRAISPTEIKPCRIIDTTKGVRAVSAKVPVNIKPNGEVLATPLYPDAHSAYEDTLLKKLCCDFNIESFMSTPEKIVIGLYSGCRKLTKEWLQQFSLRVGEVAKNAVTDLLFSVASLRMFIVADPVPPIRTSDIPLVKACEGRELLIKQPDGTIDHYYCTGHSFLLK